LAGGRRVPSLAPPAGTGQPSAQPSTAALLFGVPLGTDLPIGAVLTLLRCWTLLYGAVSMEVFGHMSFALEDPAPMFEITLGDLASLVGLRYPLPR
jgi:hypothetical protein